MKFILKASILNMLYKQDNSGKKIYWRNLHGGKFTEWSNFKSGRSNFQQQPEKTATILPHQQWFTREMTSEKRAQKFHTDDKPLPRSSLMLVIGWKFASSNQKHYPDPGSDALSVENFCVCSSDTISRGNQWVGREMFAVFPG